MKTYLLIGDQKTLFNGLNAVTGFPGKRKAVNSLAVITYEMGMGMVRFRMCFIINVNCIQPVSLFIRYFMDDVLFTKMIQGAVQRDLVYMLPIQSFSNISMRKSNPGVEQYIEYLYPDRSYFQAVLSEYVADGFSIHAYKDMLNATKLQIIQRPV